MIRSLAILGILLLAIAARVQAQSTTIIFDGTMGTAGELDPTKPGDYDILDSAGGYDDTGTNLFHSFETFELLGGDTATFSAYQGSPSRVIVRVTLGSGTIVDGTLRSGIKDSFGNGADLIWIDPHGVHFKDQASLEVIGSAHFSSAHELHFDDGSILAAAPENLEPIDVAMLSVAPSDFGFSDAAGEIVLVEHSQGLGVSAGETLGFVGVDSSSGQAGVSIINSSLSAQSSTIYIASAAGPTDIPLDPQAFDLGGYDPESLGAVSIQSGTIIEAASDPGDRPGEIVIRSGKFTMAASQLIASNAASAVSPGTSIDIAVSRDFKLDPGDPGAQIRSVSDSGHAGDVVITADKIEMSGQKTQILVASDPSEPDESAAGPDLHLHASSIELNEGARMITQTESDQPGGAIYIDTERFSMAGGSDLLSIALGVGPGGEITILATESVELSDPDHLARFGTVATHSFFATSGPAGNLTIHSGTISVENGAVVESIASGSEPGGTIQLHADTVEVTGGGMVLSETTGAAPGGAIEIDANAVVVAGSAGKRATIQARAGAEATGDGGAIEIHTTSLDVLDGGLISSDTLGLGNAGGIAIHGRGPEEDSRALRVTVEGGPTDITGISSNTVSQLRDGPGDANGGNIAVDVERLELVNGGFLTVSTAGPGDAGSIDIRAGSVEIRGEDPMNNNSGVFAQSLTKDAGGGGGITINTDGNLTVSDHGWISVSTSGEGDAGLIDLIVGGTLLLSGPGGDRGNVEASHKVDDALGSPGDIQIAASSAVRLLDGATITTESLGPADAGNITIDAGRRFEAIGSKVTTAANEASGGQVSITASELVYLLDSEVSTDVAVAGAGGGGGDVMIGDPETVVPEFVVLNEGRISASARDGAGGRIDIETGTFFASAPFAINPGSPPDSGSFLDATSDIPELTGTVNVEPPETELVTELASLPAAFLDASALLGSACEARTSRAGSFQVQRYAADLAPPDAALAPVGLHQTPGIRVLPVGRDLCASPEETL